MCNGTGHTDAVYPISFRGVFAYVTWDIGTAVGKTRTSISDDLIATK